MTDLSRHTTFLLQLLANEGPLAHRQLQNILNRLGPGAAIRMEQALGRLVRTGNVLMTDPPGIYNVAPARLLYKRDNPPTFELVGHPGAEQLLRLYGDVVGPNGDGVRHFTLTEDVRNLGKHLAKFGISIGGPASESN